MTEFQILKENQADFFKAMKNRGYSAISIDRHRFAIEEFLAFAKSPGGKDLRLVSQDAIVKFIGWKLSRRRKRKYHPSYRSRVAGSLGGFLQWYFVHCKQNGFNKAHLTAMSPVYIGQCTPRYPRWPIETAKKHEQFFDYLEKMAIKNLRKISRSTIDDFQKRCELTFYRSRRKYNGGYVRNSLTTPLKNYFSYLKSAAIIRIDEPEHDIQPTTLFDGLLEPYLEFCNETCGLVATSVLRVEKTLYEFSQFLDREGVHGVATINIGHVDLFGRRKQWGRSALATENSILRRFLKWLYIEGRIESDLSCLIISPKQWALSDVPDFLSENELTSLLDFPSLDSSPVSELNRCLVMLLLFTGIRIGEAAKLEIDDINWDKKIGRH